MFNTFVGILQLRPNFSYIDKTAKRKREAELSVESGDEEAGPSTAEQVTVKFKKPTGDLQKAETSFKKLRKMNEQEAWIPCEYHPENSTVSAVSMGILVFNWFVWNSRFQLERLKLFTENAKEDAGEALDLPNSSYVKILVPEDKEQSKIEPCLPSNVVSLHALRALPMQEQCKLLLKDGKYLL